MKENIYNLIIIGGGPAGLTAAIYAARAQLAPLIIEGSQPGGQLMGTTYVENWPGETKILGPMLMMNMKKHAEKVGSTFLSEVVTNVDFSQKPFGITTNKGASLKAHTVIVATGGSPQKLGCPGEKEYWGKGVSTCSVCDGAFYPNKEVIIVGGGDTAMEGASFLAKITDKITIVHILDTLTASKSMQKRILENPHIKVIYSSTVSEIRGDGKHVTDIVITNQKTKEKRTLKTDALFLAIGYRPNTEIFKGQLNLDKRGYIVVSDNTKASTPGIFVAGDVADCRYRQAITSAGSGCMAALDTERYLINK